MFDLRWLHNVNVARSSYFGFSFEDKTAGFGGNCTDNGSSLGVGAEVAEVLPNKVQMRMQEVCNLVDPDPYIGACLLLHTLVSQTEWIAKSWFSFGKSDYV